VIDPGIIARTTHTGFNLALRQGEAVEYVNSDELFAIRKTAGKTVAVLPGREAQTVKSLNKLIPTLKKYGGWVEIGRGFFVNLYRLRRSEKNKKGAGYLLTFDDGSAFTLLPGYEAPILDFLGEKSLLQVSPISLPQYYLMQMGVKDLDKDILYMTKEELIKAFSTASGSGIVASVLIVNFVWQMVLSIRSGKPSPVKGGNVRSIYYRLKPVLSRLGIIKDRDAYKILSDRLAEMVALKICSYREFGLIEPGDWSIGLYNPNVIIMAEKRAHYDMILRELQDATGASIVATGGQPSTISSEYFVEDLRKKLDTLPPATRVVLLGIVDYDPFGSALLNTFAGDLKTFGVPDVTVIPLTVPANFTPEELEMLHYDIAEDGKTPAAMLRKWMKITNGIDGKPWGMEAGYFIENHPRTLEIIIREGKPFFLVPPPVPKRFWKEMFKHQENLYKQAHQTLERLHGPIKPRRRR